MQNQETLEVKKISKREYNRQYYQKNKTRWPGMEKEKSFANVFHLFSRKRMAFQSKGSKTHVLLGRIELALLALIIVVITSFLIREAAAFYLDSQDPVTIAYIKAVLLEGVAILFSFSRSQTLVLKWTQRLAVVALCAFTIFVMSGKVVRTASSNAIQVELARQNLKQLEAELSQKEGMRSELMSRSRIRAARRYELGIDVTREKLVIARREFASMDAPQIIFSKLAILIAFRLLLVMSNLICIHRLVEKLEANNTQNRSLNQVEKLKPVLI